MTSRPSANLTCITSGFFFLLRAISTNNRVQVHPHSQSVYVLPGTLGTCVCPTDGRLSGTFVATRSGAGGAKAQGGRFASSRCA